MKRDTLQRLKDQLLSALSLLTRLPLPNHQPAHAQAAWAWPLVGALLGTLAAVTASALLALGIAPGPTAAVTLALLALLTGAIHEDGLSDSADGLMGGRTPDRRLDIMKDSRIGSFGALALLLVTLATWSALTSLIATNTHWPALIAAAALSRAPMAVVMAALPPARVNGLSAGTGRPAPGIAALGTAVALTTAFLCLGPHALAPAIAAAAVSALLALTAHKLIGGQTGDILGASQQLSFAAILSLLA